MVNKHSKDLLFNIESEAQLESIKPLLDHLRDNTKKTFDIVVPWVESEKKGPNKYVYDACATALTEYEYDIIRSSDGVILPENILSTKYKVLLSPYIYKWQYDNLKVDFRIMYPYASYYLNKPSWTIEQFIQQDYLADALLSHAVGSKLVTDIFTKTYIVPSLKLMNLQPRVESHSKPVVLFAPTYSEVDFSETLLNDIDVIKKKYKVIMRGHSKAVYNKKFSDSTQKLLDMADKVYAAESYSLVECLQEADVVVSDNSAVIFDAIYCNIPVALYSKDPNSNGYRDINTAQSKLVQTGDVLWTDDSGAILDILNKTLSNQADRQARVRKKLFPNLDSTDPVKEWMDVVDLYLEGDIPPEYSLAKRYWVENIELSRHSIDKIRIENESLKSQLSECKKTTTQAQDPGVKAAGKHLARACLNKLRLNER